MRSKTKGKMMHYILALLILFTGSTAWAAISDLPGAPDSWTPPHAYTPGAISSGPHTFDAGDPTMAERLWRDGVASGCAPNKVFPGTLGPGTYRYKTFNFVNTGPGTCVTVLLDAGVCEATFSVHLAAYQGAFNPADLSQNYLGDVGSSVSQPFSFDVPVGATVVILAHQNNPGDPDCSFSFSSNELSDSATSIPAMNSIGVVLLSLIILAFAYYRMRQTA